MIAEIAYDIQDKLWNLYKESQTEIAEKKAEYRKVYISRKVLVEQRA